MTEQRQAGPTGSPAGLTPPPGQASAFWVTAPGRGELRREPLPDPAPGEALVRTLYSGISRGTESLVFRGEVPPSEYQTMHEQLREWGINISVGQINALLSGHTTEFLAEKDQILTTALAVSRWISVDDSGARHQGRNGYVTQIGNDWFAWFSSTASKSRINFLQLLHAGEISYTVTWTWRSSAMVPANLRSCCTPCAGFTPSNWCIS